MQGFAPTRRGECAPEGAARHAAALRRRGDRRRGAVHRPRSVRQKVFVDKGSDAGIQAGRGGGRRRRRRRAGHARVSRHGGGDARHRQGSRGAGQDRAQRRARGAVRRRRRPRARACASWRRPPTSQIGDVLVTSGLDGTYPAGLAVARRWQHSSATPARCSRASPARRSPASTAASTCSSSAAKRALPPRPEEPAEADAAKKGRAQSRGARDEDDPQHVGHSRPASSDEILRPVKPWFIVLTLLLGARRQRRAVHACGVADAAARLPRAGAAVLVHPGAALRRRGHCLGRRPADGRRRCDAVRPACARLRVARLRGRIFPPPRAALSAVAAGGAGGRAARVCAPRWCCSCGSSAARRCRAGRIRCRRSSARCCGRRSPSLLQWPQRPTRSSWRAMMTHAHVAATSEQLGGLAHGTTAVFTSPGATAGAAAGIARARAARARAASCSGAGWRSPGTARVRGVRGLFARFFYLQVVQHEPLPDARRDEPHRDRADRAQPRRDHRPQRRRARAELLRPTRWRSAVARQEPRRDDRRARARSSRSRRATASASASCSTSRRTSRACRSARGSPTRRWRASRCNRYRFPGVEIKARLFRQYPFGELASHVVGYIGRINDRDVERIAEWDETANYKGTDYIGKVGIELSYERELHGTTGVEEVEVDAGGRAVRTLSRTRAGVGQQPHAVARHQAAAGGGGRVRRPPRRAGRDRSAQRRGARVRLASPASIRTSSSTASTRRNWEELNESPDKPLLNRPLRGAYPPGSTIKPFLALGALDVRQAHARADDLRSRLFPDPRRTRTASATTSRAATAPSTCTSRSSCPATRTTTCSRARPTSTTPRASCRTLGLRRARPGIDIEGELPGMLPSREWKRQRFAGKNYRDDHRKWYLGDIDLRRHRPGLQRVHADAARARDRDDRQRRRRVPPAPRQDRSQNQQHRRARARSPRDSAAHARR